MRAVTVMFIVVALFASLIALVPPLQSAVPQPSHASCCIRTRESPNDCGRQTPGSKQDQQCCSSCVFVLDLSLTGSVTLRAPDSSEQSFASFISSEGDRSDRPPVPPPRSAFV